MLWGLRCRQEQGSLIVSTLDKPRQHLAAAFGELQKLIGGFLDFPAKNLLTEGASLQAAQTKVEAKTDKSIVLAWGKHQRKKSGDPSFKSLEISTKDSIHFVARKSTAVMWLQRESIPLIQR
jgi:hypothetical protein